MAARVVEATQCALAITHDDDRVFADLYGEVVAGLGDFAIVADEQPISVPDHLEIDLIVLGAHIEVPLQGGGRFASAQPAQHLFTGVKYRASVHTQVPGFHRDFRCLLR
jgi:hypothetical protein